ncbi:MAG: trypsin-like peptidase domain-containing protein [Planctomycetia bacterium]|nr:trypsin-like peptidase domain-containing protein [Planctomycetia bacterium]
MARWVAIAIAQEAQAESPPGEATPPAAESVEQLTQKARKSVAVITSVRRDGQHEALGSGFVIAPDGLIATNFHVIGEGRAIRVQLADGRQFDATAIHASDRQLDLAIVRIDAKDLPSLELGDSDSLKQGQSVVALGNPQGLRNSVMAGVVSGVREMEGRPMIQLAMPIEPGNSGGPLVDMRGRVQGIITMKSLVTPNLGFAVTTNMLKPLVAKPNPIPMSRWLTIGALDPREWKPLFGARWRQRAGRITVDGLGQGFGGRSLCLWEMPVPERPFEIAVTVQLNDESGAAGLAFYSDGQDRHYGFYPTNGHLRLTRFDGPDVSSWTILHDQPSRHYQSGGWNTLRVRLEAGKILCYVNDELVVETADGELTSGKVGLVKFRQTHAQFKNFRIAREIPRATVPADEVARIAKLVADIPAKGPLDPKLVEALAADPARSAAVLRQRATLLDQQAAQLRQIVQTAHEHRVIADLVQGLTGPEDKIDLFRAGLLVAKLDNEEVDVDAYREELERMGRELAAKLPADAAEALRLDTLRKYLFDENGFHGSRVDYYYRANSYLNEVLDDREGLPITLSIVYLELARRIGLKVEGIGLPGHFVVQHVPAQGESQLIDVYDGATPVSREEANRRVKEATDRDLTDEELAPMPKRAIITRMLHNLLGLAGSEPPVMHRYLNAILAIDPNSAQHHWLRAIVRYRLELREGSEEDVDWLLEKRPAGIDHTRVLDLRRALEQPR